MRFVTIAEQPDLADRLGPLIDSIWPEYMLQDPVANAYWPRLFSDFPENQFALLDGNDLIGTANSIPIAWDGHDYELPEDIAAAISAQNEPESELRPDPIFYVSDLPDEDDETWRERFKDQVLAQYDVSEEALDKLLDEADGKARELVRLIS